MIQKFSRQVTPPRQNRKPNQTKSSKTGIKKDMAGFRHDKFFVSPDLNKLFEQINRELYVY